MPPSISLGESYVRGAELACGWVKKANNTVPLFRSLNFLPAGEGVGFCKFVFGNGAIEVP
jgi:hypothetical protein